MAADNVKRKLSAIFSADVVGYSRLMGEDELATVETLNSHKQTMGNLIRHYRGRVVDSTGDNLLAEFLSVVDAVQCAVEVQQVLSSKNEDLPENRRMHFRIGINLGDVIEEGERIYGDGVNIAARVESLAEGGGVCISGSAFEQIENKLALGYQYMGEHTVKNIAKPVKVYKVPMGVVEEKGKKRVFQRWHKAALAAVAVLIVVAGALAIWNFYFRRPPIEPASKDKMAFPLPDKPSIAILPFVNMSEDPKQEYLADGITVNIISALSQIPKLFVIARQSTFAYKGKPVKIQQVAEELGVRYVLEGSVQRSGDNLRITAQLIDALGGHHLWSERYDRELKNIFALQDEITIKVIAALQVKLTDGEKARVFTRWTENLQAYLKYIQASEIFFTVTKEGNARARRLLEEVIELDSKFPPAYALLGSTYFMDVPLGSSKSPKESNKRAFELMKKAIELDDSFASAHALLGWLYILMERNYAKAIAECQRAVDLAPSSDVANIWMSLILTYSGNHEQAIRYAEQSLRLSPIPPAWHFRVLGISYFGAGRYEDAIAAYKKALQQAPNDILTRGALTAAYALADRVEEARAQAAEVLRINPKYCVEIAANRALYKNHADRERFLDGLRKAGLPETPPLPLPDKPSIAVLPFVNMSDDKGQEYFSDGITEEIINALVRWPAIVVIPRSSSFIYKSKTADAKQVSREMGVRYVLEGSVRREGNRVRVTVQLIDVTSLKHLFSERYEREMKDIFAIQDEITIKVLTAMRVSLSGEGVPSLRGKGTKSIEAYLKVLQAEDIYQAVNRSTQAQARRLTEEAIALDPEYARAYTVMAATIGNDVLIGVYENPREALQRAMALAEKAVQLDDSEEMGHRVLGFLALQNKEYEKAIAETKRAFELAPNSVMAQILVGYALYSAGRTEEAIPILEKAASSSPIPLPRALSHLGIVYRKAGRLEEAVAVCRKLIKIKPNYIFPHLTLAAAFAEMGKMEEARAEVREVMRIRPKYTLKLVPKSFPWKDQDEIDRLIDSLRKAGLK